MSDDKEKEQDFSFLKEKIKDKSFNRKKAAGIIGCTIGLAILFGTVASFAFFMSNSVLGPIFGNQTGPEKVVIPRDDSSLDEFSEESSSIEEASLEESIDETSSSIKEGESSEIMQEETQPVSLEQMYQEMYNKAKECEKFMVTVTGVSSDVDWFHDTHQNKGQSSGMIVASNGTELLICADYSTVKEAESITVTFYDEESALGTVKQYDGSTGLAILSVPLSEVPISTVEEIHSATLGNSYLLKKGDFVIAIGSPLGYSESVSYGIITSPSGMAQAVDNNLHLLSTNIFGSSTGSGVLINSQGDVIGILEPSYGPEGNQNILTALAISDLKSTIERLSNNQSIVYAGIKGSDVTQEIAAEHNIPKGVYVTEVRMDSPAMTAGIQSGDVITNMNEEAIATVREFQNELISYEPGQAVTITAMRQGKGEWKKITFTVTLGSTQ